MRGSLVSLLGFSEPALFIPIADQLAERAGTALKAPVVGVDALHLSFTHWPASLSRVRGRKASVVGIPPI
jgi:hypothetical protein